MTFTINMIRFFMRFSRGFRRKFTITIFTRIPAKQVGKKIKLGWLWGLTSGAEFGGVFECNFGGSNFEGWLWGLTLGAGCRADFWGWLLWPAFGADFRWLSGLTFGLKLGVTLGLTLGVTLGLTLDRNNNLTFDCHICHIFGSFSLCKHQEILYHNLHISIQEYHHFHPHVDLLQGIS